MGRVAVISALMFALGCAQAPAEESASESRQVQSIVRTTNSPFCPGKTLDSCPSPRAAAWRQDINQWVEDGVPAPEIRGRLQARVPEFELSVAPVKSGWVIPVVAVVLSTLWFVVMVRRFRSRSNAAPRVESQASVDDLDARLDEELARFD